VEDVTVRACGPEDEPALIRLAAESMAPQLEAAGARFDAARSLRALEDDVVFVAESGGKPAGYVTVRQEAEALVVDQLAVGVADQGRHVGHRLLDWVEGYGMSRRLARVRVEVEPDNRRAREFYERRGYQAAADGRLERELVHE
jgi:ribosomal protein S18 acetylase RimI-like enzyme